MRFNLSCFRHNRVSGQFRPPHCITSANQTRERVQNTRLFALTLSIYYGYIVQANSLRANRHIVLNTETKDTFLRWREKSGQTERWDTTGGNRDSTGGTKPQKTPPLPSGGWVTNSTSFVLDFLLNFFGISQIIDSCHACHLTLHCHYVACACSGSADDFSRVASVSQSRTRRSGQTRRRSYRLSHKKRRCKSLQLTVSPFCRPSFSLRRAPSYSLLLGLNLCGTGR